MVASYQRVLPGWPSRCRAGVTVVPPVEPALQVAPEQAAPVGQVVALRWQAAAGAPARRATTRRQVGIQRGFHQTA